MVTVGLLVITFLAGDSVSLLRRTYSSFPRLSPELAAAPTSSASSTTASSAPPASGVAAPTLGRGARLARLALASVLSFMIVTEEGGVRISFLFTKWMFTVNVCFILHWTFTVRDLMF